MATIYYSVDGGETWTQPKGDAWPSTAGRHIIRREFRDAPYSRRVMVRITSTDADVWQVRKIAIKGQIEPQEASTGASTSIEDTVVPRRFSQETEPTIDSGELAVWHIPSTGKVWFLYNDVQEGNLRIEPD